MNDEELKLCNEWAAEKCGVEVVSLDDFSVLYNYAYKGMNYYHGWTLSDARCREIVREHFNIGTEKFRTFVKKKDCIYWQATVKGNHAPSGVGKTIEAAELACINAIRLSEVDK